jgi:hypothetical protein
MAIAASRKRPREESQGKAVTNAQQRLRARPAPGYYGVSANSKRRCASLLDNRRSRRAVASCGLRAPFCIGAPCVISTCTILLQW